MRFPIYLDHNATTPVDPRVLEAMLPHFSREFGNAASRTHAFGWRAERAVDEGRERVARAIGARTREIVLTSGATEANNIAILGVAARHTGPPGSIVVGRTEHRAVLDPCRELERRGWTVRRPSPDRHGVITAEQVERAIGDDTVLVSMMAANNETGTLHPLAEIGAVTRAAGVILHSDAAQAIGRIPIDVEALGIDLLSISGHKCYGPQGIGALFVRSRPRVPIGPVVFGGGHENGLRSGTLPVALAVGLGAAVELAEALRETDAPRLATLADRLRDALLAELPDSVTHGHPEARLPGTLSIGFPGVEADSLLLALPEIAFSSGSACTSAELEPSHVLRAMEVPTRLAHGSVRFCVGRETRPEEVDFAAERVIAVVRRLKRSGS